MLCKRDGRHIHNKRDPVGLSRGTADHSHQGFTGFFQVREIVLSGKFRPLLLQPGVKKEFLEFSHGRTFYLNVRVAPVNWCIFVLSPSEGTARIYLADVDATDNGKFYVDYQNIAVVPVCQ